MGIGTTLTIANYSSTETQKFVELINRKTRR